MVNKIRKSLFQSGELDSLGRFYIYELIFAISFGLFVPFMTIYFVEQGLSFLQISSLMAALTVTNVLFEVPTGAFADHFSRKYSVVLGFVIMALGILPIPLIDQYWLLVLLFIVQGFGMTFISGAEEAWVVDNLKTLKQEKLVEDYYIKATVIFGFGGIVAPLLAGQIVQHFSIDWLWYLFGGGSLLSAAFAWLFLPELHKPKRSEENAVSATAKNTIHGFSYIYNHKPVMYVILGGIFFGIMWAISDFWQPYFVELSLPTYALGYVYSGMSALTLLLPFLLKVFADVSRYTFMVAISLTRMLLTFAVAVLSPELLPLAVGIFVLSGALTELSEPIIGPLIQKQIPSERRATIMSIYSMGLSASIGLFGLLYGRLADQIGLQKTIVLGGVWGIVSIYLFLKAKRAPHERNLE